MIHVTCRLTAKNRDQLWNPTLGNRVWATFIFFTDTTQIAELDVRYWLLRIIEKHVTNVRATELRAVSTVKVQKVKWTIEHAYEKYQLTIMKTYKRDDQNLFKSIKTTYDKIVASKTEVVI